MASKSRGGGGGLSRRAAIALIGGGGLLGLSSTGAFSQVDDNRPFSVATATDANALLAVGEFDEDETYSQPHTVTITNQLSGTLDDNTVSIDDENIDGENLELFKSGRQGEDLEMDTLEPGEGDRFKIVIPNRDNEEDNEGRGPPEDNKEDNEGRGPPEDNEQVSNKITILYKGSGTTVEITREITVTR